jgi:hypothetical protein
MDSANGGDSAGGGRGGRRRGGGGSSSRGPRERYVVCLRYNAKDRDGHYAGVKTRIAIYAGGRLDGYSEEPHGACDQTELKPFPELEKLTR